MASKCGPTWTFSQSGGDGEKELRVVPAAWIGNTEGRALLVLAFSSSAPRNCRGSGADGYECGVLYSRGAPHPRKALLDLFFFFFITVPGEILSRKIILPLKKKFKKP